MGETFQSTDPELIQHTLSSSYGRMRLRARGEPHEMRQTQSPLSPAARLDHVSFAMSFDADADPLGVLVFGDLKSGRIRHSSDGSDRCYRPGSLYLTVLPGHPSTGTVEDADLETAVLDPALPGRFADGAPGRRCPQPVRFTGYEPVSAWAARQWRATYAFVRDTILAGPYTASQPLVVASAVRLLTASALAAFPNNAVTEPTAADRRDASPPALRRAMAFIEENAHRDITVADIAAAAFVTIRATQLAFRQHLDTTPTKYLRRVRLERARQELVNADPTEHTVTAVAYRWGFPSPSRFAAAYRKAYGVHPSDTLHRD